ncbi:MAG: AI-2E family transporter [Deltaproteobacteria bacterium]|nr:AI-2E family transporter [Deltaproteobacteria bacterium]
MAGNPERPLSSRRIARVFTQILVWGGLALVLYLLRSFFLLIFLTFVFSYLLTQMSKRLEGRLRWRSLRVVIVTLLFLGLLTGIGAFIIPNLKAQGELFTSQFTTYLQRLDAQIFVLAETHPQLGKLLPIPDGIDSQPHPWQWSQSPTVKLAQSLGASGDPDDPGSMKEAVRTLSQIGGSLFGIGSAFFLSLLFSFLIVLDLPGLQAGVRGLKDTKIGFIYHEVAPTISEFGTVLGRALEAQLIIALFNTVLTVMGLYVLGIGQSAAFLAVIVFLCSFIPVAGVFISSVPICLLALETSGVHGMFLAVALITLIHMVEAYILNPKIYGHHLKMNPVLVLIILTLSGKLFHVWGLVLGVPICTYIFGHAIRRRKQEESL